MSRFNWQHTQMVGSLAYICWNCSLHVGPSTGYFALSQFGGQKWFVLICPKCDRPTFIDNSNRQYPSPSYGKKIEGITDNLVEALYDEARSCFSQSAFTCAVMMCRKILMHLAVHQGADKDLKFVEYVNYLSDKGYVPPNGKSWVEKIRKKGNEANHEIVIMNSVEATQIMKFTEMLLRFIYEFSDESI